jgi:hypothetical protein
MGDRGRLHVGKVDDFAAWLEAHGWRRVDAKGIFEVLRMERPIEATPAGESRVLLVHRKDTETQHYSLHGESSAWFSRWMRELRRIEEGRGR